VRGIDLRITTGGRVVSRHGASGTDQGERVRLVADGSVCEGVLGPTESSSAAVRGCAGTDTLFALVRPPSMTRWPRARPASDPRAVRAIAAAREAATTAGHLRGDTAWSEPRVVILGDALYVLVSCPESAAALVRVRGEGAPEVLLARPAHGIWSREELVESHFAWRGIVDVDGDGVVEVIETQMGESAFMVRLVRPGPRIEGDIVWSASYRDDPLDASVDHPPRPVPPRALTR